MSRINLKGDRTFIPFRQLGQYEDIETGLYYNRFRYYDPNTGTYISKDPIGLAGGFALYAYVKDVNKFIDVFGLECSKTLSNGKNIQDLVNQGNMPDRNGLTKVGRAQQKHSNREGSVFQKPQGNKAMDYNVQGEKELTNILNNEKVIQINKYGGFDVIDITGKGARFGVDDIFVGFLEP